MKLETVGELHPEVPPILVNKILQMLFASRVTVHTIEGVVDTDRKIPCPLGAPAEQGEVRNEVGSGVVAGKRPSPADVLGVRAGKKLPLE